MAIPTPTHVVPYAAGGEPTADNLQLRCRAHNGYEAELYFGRRTPSGVREARAPDVCPPEPPPPPSRLAQGRTRSGPRTELCRSAALTARGERSNNPPDRRLKRAIPEQLCLCRAPDVLLRASTALLPQSEIHVYFRIRANCGTPLLKGTDQRQDRRSHAACGVSRSRSGWAKPSSAAPLQTWPAAPPAVSRDASARHHLLVAAAPELVALRALSFPSPRSCMRPPARPWQRPRPCTAAARCGAATAAGWAGRRWGTRGPWTAWPRARVVATW